MNSLRLLVLALVACDSGATPAVLPPRSMCVVAVVASDYRSTSVSLLTGDGQVCAPDLITSGSRPPGLLTAVSGDAVLPSEADPAGLLHIIDRYPNAVVTSVDPATGEVVAQRAASPGFSGNPQDIAFVGKPVSMLLSRLERARDADPPIGSDLLELVDPPVRIDLSQWADPGLDPMPTRFARATGQLWIGLTHLAPDFARAGPGRALALDAATLVVTHVLSLAPLQNCGMIASASPAAGLWAVCSGLFRNSRSGPQREFSGLAWLGPAQLVPGSLPLEPTWSLGAADLHAPGQTGRPLGFTLAALDDAHALVVALGDLETALPDRLLLVDRIVGSVVALAESGPFELGAVLARSSERLILVADANPRKPRIRRFTWPTEDAPARELEPVDVSPTGLPPRYLAAFR